MDKQYSPDEVEDIKAREKLALERLRELQLTPAVVMTKEKIGENNGREIWGDVAIPYLQDTKYTPIAGVPTKITDFE